MKDSLSRRDLFKLAAAVSMLSVTDPEELFASQDEKLITHGSHFGAMEAVVKNGKFIKVLPHPKIHLSSEMLFSMADYVNSPNRIKTPCVRKSYLEGKNRPDMRGAEEFIAIPWNDALDLVAERLDETKNNCGNESIFRTSFAGWSHPGVINRPNILQGRFLGLFGGFSDTMGDYSAGAATQILPHVTGTLEIYSRQTAYEVIAENTKTIILWGFDPLKTMLINYGVNDYKQMQWFRRFKKLGIKFISIDPVYTDTAQELEAEWIPIRPTTDTAMIMAMCNYLYKSGKYSKDFMDKYTVGFSQFARYIIGKEDGVEKTVKWAHNICGVEPAQISRLISKMLEPDTLIASNYGAQRSEHGEQFHWSLITLACMLGHLGTKAGGLQLGGGGLSRSDRNSPKRISQGRNPATMAVPASRLGDMLLNPGRMIDFNGTKITYPNVKLIYSMGANALNHQQNTNNLLAGLRNIETIITHETMWNSWAKISDIVLPATTTFERNDIACGNAEDVRYIWAMKQVVKPMYMAKDDYWILSQLAKRLGFEKKFTLKRSIMDWIRWSYNGLDTKIPFNDFWKKGYLEYKIPEANKSYVRMSDFISNPQGKPLFTPSGKIEIYSEKVASFGYSDCKGHPAWYQPKEWLGSKLVKKHKYHLLSLHSKYRLHSQLDNLPLNKKYKVNGREPIIINPGDAKVIGIKSGDTVEVYNERGVVVCCAVVSAKVMKGVVRLDEGAWYAPEIPGKIGSRCLSGSANILTPSKPTSRLAQACTANSCLVSIRKASGNIKSNPAYTNPVIKKR